MADKPLVDLVIAAANLKAAGPPLLFDKMVEAVRGHEKAAISEMLSARDPHELLRLQGYVEAARQLRRHLQNCQQMRADFVRRNANG